MKKLMIAAASAAAIGFSAVADAPNWFDGGITTGWPTTATGGTWSNVGTMSYSAEAKGVEVTAAKETPLTFTAAEAKDITKVESATITSTVTFSPFPADEKPEIPADAKAGVIVVKETNGTLAYYVLRKPDYEDTTNAWMKANTDLEATNIAVAVTITMSVDSGYTVASYYIGDTTIEGDAFLAGGTEVSTVCYAGDGTVASLTGTYAGGERPIWDGEGTEEKPYVIWSVDGLAKLATEVNAGTAYAGTFFQLEDDLELTEKWPGIGVYKSGSEYTQAFKGVFDGNGKTISNVVMAKTTFNNYRGFFNQTDGAIIKNLTVETSGFDAADFTAGEEYGCAAIVGSAFRSTIENCVSDGEITSATHNAGGIAIRILDSTIKNCTNEADITGNYTKVAGICVLNQSSTQACLIEGCVNNGDITAEGNVSKAGQDGIAGIVAYVGDDKLTIKDCSNTGAIIKGTDAKPGQIVGYYYSNLTLDGTITGTPDALMIGAYNGARNNVRHFATVAEGVATLIADADVEVGGNYKAMATGGAFVLPSIGDSITIDTSLATVNVTTTATDAKVVQNGNIYTVVLAGAAKIGTEYYISLKDANDAAKAGDTITLLADASGDGIFVSKDVTFDFGGFTYTVTGNAVGSPTWESQGFHIETANCALTNGTLTSTSGSGVKMLVQNYSNLTVEYMTLDGTKLDVAFENGDYVLSNNKGEITIIQSTINAKPGDFAFDSCKYANYPAPTVTVVDSDINGRIEVTGGKVVINNGTDITGPENGKDFDGKAVITVDGATSVLEFNQGNLGAYGTGSDGMYGVYVCNGGKATFGDENYGPTINSHFAAIGANNTKAPVTIIVNDGYFTQQATPAAGAWWSYFCAAIYAPAAGTYTINGGTFDGALYSIASRYANVDQTITINGGTFEDPIFVDEQVGAGTGTRTITKAAELEIDVLPADTYEWKDGTTLVKKSTGPEPAPGSQSAVVEDPENPGTYVVTPTSEEVTAVVIQGVKDTDTLVINGGAVDSLTVDSAPKAVKVMNTAGSVEITDAVKGWNGNTFDATLDETKSVKVGEETIPVKPTATEATEGGTIADGAVATKAIPGLTYTLKRGTELGTYGDNADSKVADGTTVSLKDANKPADKAFYVIEVTK